MPSHFHYRLEVPCSHERAFGVLTDWESWRHCSVWGDIRWIEGSPWQPGSRRRMEALVPFRYTVEQKILTFDPAGSYTAVTHGHGFTNTITFWVRPLPHDGTAEITIRIDMAGIMATLLDLAIDQVVERFMDAYLKELKSRCERVAQPQPS